MSLKIGFRSSDYFTFWFEYLSNKKFLYIWKQKRSETLKIFAIETFDVCTSALFWKKGIWFLECQRKYHFHEYVATQLFKHVCINRNVSSFHRVLDENYSFRVSEYECHNFSCCYRFTFRLLLSIALVTVYFLLWRDISGYQIICSKNCLDYLSNGFLFAMAWVNTDPSRTNFSHEQFFM